jgi:hypothetical protein
MSIRKASEEFYANRIEFLERRKDELGDLSYWDKRELQALLMGQRDSKRIRQLKEENEKRPNSQTI